LAQEGERTEREAERPRNDLRLFLYEINFIRAKSMVKRNSDSYAFPRPHPNICSNKIPVVSIPLFSINIPITFLCFSYSYVFLFLHSKEGPRVFSTV
jgi:hypothetical protein